jgi:hypothetical protein
LREAYDIVADYDQVVVANNTFTPHPTVQWWDEAGVVDANRFFRNLPLYQQASARNAMVDYPRPIPDSEMPAGRRFRANDPDLRLATYIEQAFVNGCQILMRQMTDENMHDRIGQEHGLLQPVGPDHELDIRARVSRARNYPLG